MNDDIIIKQRISGQSVPLPRRTAARWPRLTGCWISFVDATITNRVRKHTLALELARLDELQEAFYEQAMGGDVQSGALVAKIIERRCTMLGLYTPPATTLQVVEAQAPKKTSTQEMRGVLDNIMGITARERELLDRRQATLVKPLLGVDFLGVRNRTARRAEHPCSRNAGFWRFRFANFTTTVALFSVARYLSY